MASAGPRFFGFVIGGSHPVAVAASWLAAAWDQNAGASTASPVAAALEQVAQRWLVELFGLPSTTVAGFVTGATMANMTALAAARHAVLAARRLGRGREGPRRCAAGHRDRRRRGAPVAAQGGRAARPRQRAGAPRGGGRPGTHARGQAAADLGSDDRLHAGGQREHRRLRPGRGDRRPGPRGRGLGARRRRVRALGGRGARARAPGARRGNGRLVGHGRAQVAQRSLRQRVRVRARPRAPSRGHGSSPPRICRTA